jgi:E3 ubiquitin-protein ligase DOA10
MAGECQLENMQTLCVVCHTNVTIEQNCQRRSEIKRARQRLQMRVKRLNDRLNGRKRSRLEEGSLNLNDAEKRMQQELCDSSESDDDKELLEINVAGSAYSASSPNHNITNLRSTVLPVEDQGSLDEQPLDDEVLVKIKDKSSTYLASSSQTVVDLTTILDTAELGAQVTDDKTVADHKGSSSCSGLSLKQKVDVSLRAAILTVDDQESLDDNQDNNFSSESESHGCTDAAPAAEGLVSGVPLH